jgi:hypothetical protein
MCKRGDVVIEGKDLTEVSWWDYLWIRLGSRKALGRSLIKFADNYPNRFKELKRRLGEDSEMRLSFTSHVSSLYRYSNLQREVMTRYGITERDLRNYYEKYEEEEDDDE